MIRSSNGFEKKEGAGGWAKKKKYAPSGVRKARGVSSGAGTTSNGGREGLTYRVAVPAVFPQDSAPVPGASRFLGPTKVHSFVRM